MAHNIKRIWKYYQNVAHQFGTKKNHKPYAYSLEQFYLKSADVPKAPLIRAFLGDQKALKELDWHAPAPSREEILAFSSAVTPPYSAQITAIQHAVTDPVSLIQGPPGTGKTEMILNLMAVIHGLYPERTVAVVSGNREAVKNVTDKISEREKTDPRLAPLASIYAPLGRKENRENWMKIMKQRKENTDCFQNDFMLHPSFFKQYPFISSTIHSLWKSFLPQKDWWYQFDYVIVDECSQISNLLGLVAMGCAKHLVLIGDNQQLQPIIHENRLRGIHKKFSDVPAIYREAEQNTFLSVCETLFKGYAGSTFLNQHYRCHPAIIGFCNEYVYGGQLEIMKKPDNQFPIRVVWYEGDYFERISNKRRHNLRQIRIFMQEEWPQFLERLQKNPDLSICVIAPFREQLQLLKDKLEQNLQTTDILAEIELETADTNENSDENHVHSVPQLTIHKVQGKGFDIVCFMPVEDCSYSEDWPWSQQRRMLNVAVSRAKKEFHIIVSSQWLPKNLQRQWTHYVLPVKMPGQSAEEADNLFVHKLLAYVAANGPEKDPVFGFHKSQITSVFDQIPLHRLMFETRWNHDDQAFAPARCIRDALFRYFSKQYSICAEMPLSALIVPPARRSAEMLSYIQKSRLDFVICKENEVMLILEIDGIQHRTGNERLEENDNKKDTYLKSILPDKRFYLRLPTDGSTENEVDMIRKRLEFAEQCQNRIRLSPEITAERTTVTSAKNHRDDLLLRYKTYLKAQMQVLEGWYGKGITSGFYQHLCLLNYARQESREVIPYHDSLLSQFYLCRYGLAYAFEYAFMYEILLRSWNSEYGNLDVCSFGCGALIDAWSLAYARASLLAAHPDRYVPISYTGVDKALWPDSIIDPCAGRMVIPFEEIRYSQNGIEAFWQEGQSVITPVLMFPKILNELKPDVQSAFIRRLRTLHFPLPEYYICISHSATYLEEGLQMAEQIVQAINAHNAFTCNADLREIMGDAQYTELKRTHFHGEKEDFSETQHGSLKCYTFRSAAERPNNIRFLNPDFNLPELKEFMGQLDDKIKQYETTHPSARPLRTVQVTSVKAMVFQIIKLKRR